MGDCCFDTLEHYRKRAVKIKIKSSFSLKWAPLTARLLSAPPSHLRILPSIIAGMASEQHVIHLARRLGADLDHFAQVRKMVLRLVAGVVAGGFCLLNDRKKIAPLGVAEEYLQISGEPALYSIDFRMRLVYLNKSECDPVRAKTISLPVTLYINNQSGSI